MMNPTNTPTQTAAKLQADIQTLPRPNTTAVRALRRQYSQQLKQADPAYILELAHHLIEEDAYRWVAYELVRYHNPTFATIKATRLESLGQGMKSWHDVDSFARTLSGPAWLQGHLTDDVIHRWAASDDVWWRRAALVSTVALNMRSHGGPGDADRTLAVCRLLVQDHEDTIQKAMSWALRELIVHDAQAVRDFLSQYEADLAARVKREVNNKLATGLKNPKKR